MWDTLRANWPCLIIIIIIISDGLTIFDTDVRHCFSDFTGVYTADTDWMQVQLSLRRGGLGLHSLALHSPAAYLESLITAGLLTP